MICVDFQKIHRITIRIGRCGACAHVSVGVGGVERHRVVPDLAILKAQRGMLQDIYHSENPTKMDRAALLQYIYYTASKYGWEYPDMDQYKQRTRIGKSCTNSRPIGKGPKPPAGILPKKDRPQRALSRHQRFMKQVLSHSNLRAEYPDARGSVPGVDRT
eukprot:COSAG02_NODE_801_length_17030_cov_150.308428_5_plen_160_part_00